MSLFTQIFQAWKAGNTDCFANLTLPQINEIQIQATEMLEFSQGTELTDTASKISDFKFDLWEVEKEKINS